MPLYFQNVDTNEAAFHRLQENPCSILDFARLALAPGEEFEGHTGDCETLLVALSGLADVTACGVEHASVGGRRSPFDGKPHAVYMPPDCAYHVRVSAEGAAFDAALTMARASDGTAPFLIEPDHVLVGKHGISNFSRSYHELLVKGQHLGRKVSRLIVGETYTPSGNWSSYPPHRHDVAGVQDNMAMEEMCYFRVQPAGGWGLARHYTEDGDIDAAYTIKDNTVLTIPRGYHTIVSAPGYTTYCLWFLAGATRERVAITDPNTAWVSDAIPMIRNIEENLS